MEDMIPRIETIEKQNPKTQKEIFRINKHISTLDSITSEHTTSLDSLFSCCELAKDEPVVSVLVRAGALIQESQT
jgi:hypothetical protein